MNRIYRNIGMALLLTATACSTDNALEDPFLENSNGNDLGGSIAHNPYWGWVTEFPGFVPSTVPRVNAEISLQMQQPLTTTPTRFQALGWQSSGYYAAPGETVTITVPAGVSGVKYRIGGFNDVLEADATLKRYHDMNQEGTLQAGVNELMSYFGGHLYFFHTSSGSATSLQISGAVKSPDFIQGETDPAAWKQEIAQSVVPHGELRSGKIILTLPVRLLRQVTDPTALLNFYDDFVSKDCDGFYAVEPQAYPWRLRTDVQVSGTAMSKNATGGYPMVICNDSDSSIIRIPSLQDPGILNICQSFAYTYQQPSLAGEDFKDAFLLLPYHRMYHRNNLWPAIGNAYERAISDFMGQNDPSKRFNDLTPTQKSAMFIQLAQQYGWNLYPYVCKQSENGEVLEKDQDKNDALAISATEYANQNLTPFFEAWGFSLSSYAKNYMKQFPAISAPFWMTASKAFGNFDTRTAVTLPKEPRPSYAPANRSQWTVTAKRTVDGKEEDNVHVESPLLGAAANIIDDNAASIWHSKWESEKAQYPHVINVDMKTASQFNYIYYRHRNTQSHANKCRRFQLFVKNPAGEWVGIENNKTFVLGKETTEQRIYLDNMYETSQLRLVLVSPHPADGKAFSDAPNQPLSASIAEFGVGMFE